MEQGIVGAAAGQRTTDQRLYGSNRVPRMTPGLKLRLDFGNAIVLLSPVTDADAAELVERLLTAAAMVMEDANEAALIKGTQGLEARLAATVGAGQDIEVLAKAATVIARRWT